ncbi:hypothetical protein AGMMS50262_12040 [Bacteroidia bacterium]|nr:hypothetical protein AGMMS50262_12040 [Bacteroidia bacterium]
MERRRFFWVIPLGVLAIAGFSAVVMLLWNWLIPSIFGWAVINFWQALGLLALTRILFGGFGFKHRMHAGRWGHHHNPIREKWMQMTSEERKEFLRKRHFGPGCGHDFFGEEENTEKKD